MNAQRLRDTFRDLVRTDSPSGHEAAVFSYCEAILRECGCTVIEDDSAAVTGSDTGNLVATLPGTLEGDIILTAHMDCVDPCVGVEPLLTDGRIHTDGTTVLGGDDKVGVASILEAVRSVVDSESEHPTVHIIFTVQEELGCIGAKALTERDIAAGTPVYVFDMDGTPGACVVGAPYHHTFTATFTGKASHAGVAPEKGISAIEVASLAVLLIRTEGCLGRIDENSASNVGTIEGGQANNVIAPSVVIGGECRSVDEQTALSTRDAMTECMEKAAQAYGAQADIAWTLEYGGFHLSETDPTVVAFSEAVTRAGYDFSTSVSAGGSDANIFSDYGWSPIVVATGMTDFHSVTESLAVADLEATARIAEALIAVTSTVDHA